jgi:hypothetical protein
MQHGSQQLYLTVRGAMIKNGLTLNQWCLQNGVTRQWATLALKGQRKGQSAENIVNQLLVFLGLPNE